MLALIAEPAAAEQAPGTGYDRLVDALAAETRLTEEFVAQLPLRSETELRKDADIVAEEAECPGSIALIVEAMREPVLRTHVNAVKDYRAALRGFLWTRLSEDDAAGAAAFFGSELGQRFVIASGGAQVTTQRDADVASSENALVSETALAADKEASLVRMHSAIEPLLLREVDGVLSASSWFPAFKAMQGDMTKLELILANADLTAEDVAEIETRSTALMTTHFATCYTKK